MEMSSILAVSMSESWFDIILLLYKALPWGKLDEMYRGSLRIISYDCI